MFSVYSDGSKTKDGIGIGFVVYRGPKMLFRLGYRHARKGTSVVAEYLALTTAMRWMIREGYNGKKVVFHVDNKQVAEQMTGSMAIRSGPYVEYAMRAQALEKEFANMSVKWIPRAQNSEADELSKI